MTDYKTATWTDAKGRIVLVHTLSDRWLNHIRKYYRDKPEWIRPILEELKRRKALHKDRGNK